MKIYRDLLIAAISLSMVFATVSGYLQTYINFTNPLNEIVFFIFMVILFIYSSIAIIKV